ncbi:MAG: signal peptidase I, partial [Oscillospiraceae bacterium]|nr:signal peptidase I [Oscillospiraceae bacterium]
MEETKQTEQPTTDRWPGTWQQEIFHELKMLACVLAAVILIFQFAAQLIVVVGSSMYPTLHDGDLLVALRIHGELETGDIVVIHKETELIRETIIKRVIATGGQTVEIDYDNNAVYVDGLRLTEPYINLNDLQPEDGGDPMLPRGDIVRIQ